MQKLGRVRAAAAQRSLNCSDEEWSSRVALAACYRLCAHFGITDLIYTHLSARVPGRPREFLVNPNGLLFEEITASSLVKIDLDGNLIDDPLGLGVLSGGYFIHSAVLEGRPDIQCVMHVHTDAGIAVSCQEEGLLPLSQHAMRFYGRIAYFDYHGIVESDAECRGLQRALGDKLVMMLRNHGLLVAGRSIPAAFDLLYHLDRACRIQVLAQSCGAKLVTPAAATAEQVASAYERLDENDRRDWPALLRLLERSKSNHAR
ncbi:MAG TPA: class II aldolase/adducin family protein [Stellaceae bacterium]|nr:class II aldolase/adducin family protein [Stellaceae bacterium]